MGIKQQTEETKNRNKKKNNNKYTQVYSVIRLK